MPVSTRRSNGARRSASPARCAVRRFAGQPTPARVLDPGAHDRAVRVDLVEVAAAQAFVAQRADAFEQQVVRGFQRTGRLRRSPCAASAWWCHHHTCAGEMPAPMARLSRARVQRDGSPRGLERGLRVPSDQMRAAQIRQEQDLEAGRPASAAPGATRSPGTAPPPRRRPRQLRSGPRATPCPAPRRRRCSRPAADRRPSISARCLRAGRGVAGEAFVAGDDGQRVRRTGVVVETPPDLDRPPRHPARAPVQAQRTVGKRQVVVDRRLPETLPDA